MKILKLVICALVLLFVMNGHSYAQTQEADLIVKQLKSEQFEQMVNARSAVSPVIFKGEDANGPWQITLKKQDLTTPKGVKAFVYVTEFSQKGKLSAETFAESGESVYRVQGGKVIQSKSRASDRWKRIKACITSFITNGGVGQCATCYNSLLTCSGTTPWYSYLYCIGTKLAGSTCRPCVSSVGNLLSCLRSAW